MMTSKTIKFSIICCVINVVAVYLYNNPPTMNSGWRILTLGNTTFFKLLDDTKLRNLTFTQSIENYQIINTYNFSTPHIQLVDCECGCKDKKSASEAARNLYEKTHHEKCENNSLCFTISKKIQLKTCDDDKDDAIAFCYINISTHISDTYYVTEVQRSDALHHILYNGEILKNYSIKIPSTIPQFVVLKLKLIRIEDLTEKNSLNKLFIVQRNGKTYNASDKLNSKNKYNLQLPGWFQLDDSTDNKSLKDEVMANIFFGNDICKDKSKWFINAQTYTRDGYTIKPSLTDEWKLMKNQSFTVKKKSIEIENENARIHLRIFNTVACEKVTCILFNAEIIQLENKAQYLKISNLSSSCKTLDVTMGYGTHNGFSFYSNIDFKENSTKCIHLTKKMYDETPQWVCLNSKIISDKTCRRVDIQKFDNLNDANCSNDQYSTSTEIEGWPIESESKAETTFLNMKPGSCFIIEKKPLEWKIDTRDINVIMIVLITFLGTVILLVIIIFIMIYLKCGKWCIRLINKQYDDTPTPDNDQKTSPSIGSSQSSTRHLLSTADGNN